MKRTNLVLDEKLLNEATIVLGAKTYSKAVMIALQETVRRLKMLGVIEHFNSNLWPCDLREMREDRKKSKVHKA